MSFTPPKAPPEPEQVRLLEEAESLFKGIKDAPSAQKARPRLQELHQRLLELKPEWVTYKRNALLLFDVRKNALSIHKEATRVRQEVPDAKDMAEQWQELTSKMGLPWEVEMPRKEQGAQVPQ
jgi:hypothetical protein